MGTEEKRNGWSGWITEAGSAVWPLGVLAVMCAVFFWDVLWLPADRSIAGNDLTAQFLHWLRFAASSVRQGRLPLWNPYLFSGLPFVANPQPALFYPPTWLALLVPATRAFAWIIVLHLWLAGGGMYVWLRAEGASVAGALFGGSVFAFSGYFFARVYAGHVGVITTGAWLPLILWIYRRAATRRSWKTALVGGLPTGLSILAGNTAFVYVALGLVAYAAFWAWERWRKERSWQAAALPLAGAGIMLFVGLALAAVQLLPTAELAMRSTRQAGASYEFAARFSWPPGYLLTLLVPNFFGEPTHLGYWGDGVYDELIFYVGILPLLLALTGVRLRHRLTPFLSGLGLGALLLALGKHGSLHLLFYRFVPFFRMTRAPARAGFLFTLAVAALAGLVVTRLQSSTDEEVEDGDEERAWLLEPLKWPLVLSVTMGALVVIVVGFSTFALRRESTTGAGRLWHIASQTASFLIFFLLSAGWLSAWRGASRSGTRLVVLGLGLAVLDLWTFGHPLVEPQQVQENAYWRIVAQAVPDPQATRVLPWGLNEFDQNDGMPFGLRSVFGYDPLTLQRYDEFVTSLPDPRARTYDLLNAGYLVAGAPQEFTGPDHPDTPRLVHEESGVYVYERPTALPRVWMVSQVEVMNDAAMLARIHEPDFDPRTTALVNSDPACVGVSAAGGQVGEVQFVRDQGNRVEAQVRGAGGLLIFSEVYYPGWRATVDGETVQLVRADYLLRALCVPAGEHRVMLVYDPPLLKIGPAVTGLTLLLLFGVGVGRLVRQRRAGSSVSFRG